MASFTMIEIDSIKPTIMARQVIRCWGSDPSSFSFFFFNSWDKIHNKFFLWTFFRTCFISACIDNYSND